jgi:hypothetical protein
VKRRKPADTVHPETLLDLWMADKSGAPVTRKRRPQLGTVVVSSVIVLVVGAVLAKFAIDVLGVLVALVAVGLVLHVLGIRLAESEILSPSWLLIILLAIGLFAYAFLVPTESVAGLGRYMPRWLVAGLEWSEQHGWAARALSPDRTAPVTSVDTTPIGGTAATGPVRQPAVVLTATRQTATEGEPITLMARGAAGESARGTVRFYDGRRLIGSAELKAEGGTGIAYLTLSELPAGTHELHAELAGAAGSPGETLRLVVHPR